MQELGRPIATIDILWKLTSTSTLKAPLVLSFVVESLFAFVVVYVAPVEGLAIEQTLCLDPIATASFLLLAH